MRKPSFSVILIILSTLFLPLTACQHLRSMHLFQHQAKVMPAAVGHPVSQVQSFADIRQVQIEGDIDVYLYTGAKRPSTILKGDSRDTAYVTIEKIGTLLHVNVGEGLPHFGRLRIDIHVQYLTSFSFKGNGHIIGKNLLSRALNLNIDNDGRTLLEGQLALNRVNLQGDGYVQLNGITRSYLPLVMTLADHCKVRIVGSVPIKSITMHDQSWLSAYWVNTPDLTVCAKDQSYVQLGGIADRLEVELTGNARFNGRYLRAKRVFARTYGHSLAEISTVKWQHVLATDDSNVYFYNIPRSKTDFMAIHGAVLDMRDWSPFMQEYDRYNK